MTKKSIENITVVLMLAGIIFYLARGCFVTPKVQIVHHAGPALRFPQFSWQDNLSVLPVFFEFDRKLQLTSVRVVPVSPTDTNKNLPPIWQLQAVSRPVATKGFEYGADLPGMKAVVPGSNPLPLDPGKKYRLIIQAGWLKAQHEFTAQPPTQ